MTAPLDLPTVARFALAIAGLDASYRQAVACDLANRLFGAGTDEWRDFLRDCCVQPLSTPALLSPSRRVVWDD